MGQTPNPQRPFHFVAIWNGSNCRSFPQPPIASQLLAATRKCRHTLAVGMSCSNHRAFIPMQTSLRLMAILSGQARPAITRLSAHNIRPKN